MNRNDLINVIHFNNTTSMNRKDLVDFSIKDILISFIISICILFLAFLCISYQNINDSEFTTVDVYAYNTDSEALDIVDTIQYENLIPGETYTVISQITLKNGTIVEKDVSFIPDTSDGILNINY